MAASVCQRFQHLSTIVHDSSSLIWGRIDHQTLEGSCLFVAPNGEEPVYMALRNQDFERKRREDFEKKQQDEASREVP